MSDELDYSGKIGVWEVLASRDWRRVLFDDQGFIGSLLIPFCITYLILFLKAGVGSAQSAFDLHRAAAAFLAALPFGLIDIKVFFLSEKLSIQLLIFKARKHSYTNPTAQLSLGSGTVIESQPRSI